MEQNKQKILKASEMQMEKVAQKLFQMEDNGHDIRAFYLRCKLAKLVQRHGELLEKFETNGRNVKKQITLESYGFNIEFFVANATKSEELAESRYEKFHAIKIMDKPHTLMSERTK